jgi:MYXO-CTERM domain-containing protein
MRLPPSAIVLASTLLFASSARAADTFTHAPPGQLPAKSGTGRVDTKIYAPEMRFPMESGPAFANSQVYGHGGGSGPGGGQCDVENFSYPWRDNYCESRSWDMPLCPSGTGHQGQDIRAATCEKGVHWVVAAVDGTITNIGSYSVYLTAPDGSRYDYLHMSNVAVKEGEDVKRGQHLGKVSNQFGGEATTVHLHFNIKQNVAGIGAVFVPPYMSLVSSYEDLLGLHPKEPDAGPITTTTTVEPNEPEPPKQLASATLPPEPAPQEDTGCANAPGSIPSGSFVLVLGVAIAGAVRRRRRLG